MRRTRIGWSVVILGAFGGLSAMWGLQPRAMGPVAAEPAARPVAKPAAEPIAPPETHPLPAGLVTLRVQFGSRQEGPDGKAPTTWDGQLAVTGGRLHQIRVWQENPQDSVDGAAWKLATRRRAPWTRAERQKGHAVMPVVDSALLVELRDTTPDTRLEFKTAQGDFQLKLADVPLGGAPARYLQRLVQVTRSASSTLVLTAPSEDDFPAAARGADGSLYVAYVAFTHGKGLRTRATVDAEKPELDFLAQPTGGDQVLLLRWDGRRWTGPLPVTSPGQDVFRPAVAVDGGGRVWVFWSGKQGDAWELWARCLAGDKWSEPVALTSEPGAKAFVAAATDSSGRVWVAWQALRGTSADILAARQEGDRFGSAMVVADGPANEWAPAIAASADGQVAVAWDTYQKGDYDVHVRVARDGRFGPAIPVDTSYAGQMRPSIAYDAEGRLWMAYETTPERWGKDWGPTDRWGVGLYQGRSVAVRVWSEGRLWKPAADAAEAFAASSQGPAAKPAQRSQQLAAPRLAIDGSSRLWLAVRSGKHGTRTGVGNSWYEHLAWYDGQEWSGEVICPNTDNILDNRPALLADPDGGIVLVGSTDGRSGGSGRGTRKVAAKKKAAAAPPAVESRWPDPVNSELVMASADPGAAAAKRPLRLVPVESAGPSVPSPEAAAEDADVARVRAARVEIGGQTLRLMRGEFHRHTELSADGGGDGTLMDMWRYALDAVRFDWIGNGDHDNGGNREYSWWITQKTTDLYQLREHFTPVYSYERSCNYPDGHRNVVFAERGIRPLPRLPGGAGRAMDDLPADAERPNSPDTLLLYQYLEKFGGVCASHTSGTDMGTDWRDNNRKVEPIVEIFQGCRQNYEMPGAPRSNTAEDSIGGWRPLGFVSLALKKGYRLGFQASSDHGSTHISFCNCWVSEPTREGIVEALKARHVYGSTDNILADVRCGQHFMGDEFTTADKPKLSIRLIGTRPFAKVHVIRDGNYVYSAEPQTAEVTFDWTDSDIRRGTTSYYYVRGEQEDGELVWASPMWITYQP